MHTVLLDKKGCLQALVVHCEALSPYTMLSVHHFSSARPLSKPEGRGVRLLCMTTI